MRLALILLLAITLANAEFLIDRVDVAISDIKSDGSARVHESIKFVMFGNYSNSVYDSGITNNELSFWSNNTGLKDAKIHVNPVKVDIRDFRLRPQPRTKCNPIQGICHGELILDYLAYPSYNNTTSSIQPDTGLFRISRYKPRTMRYTINPSALSFTTTPEGNIILDENVFLTIKLPAESVTLDANPQPTGTDVVLPSHVDSLSWSGIVLVKFSLIFDVEESIDKEVSDFFSNIILSVTNALGGPHGIALVVLIAVLIGSYLYIMMSKRRGEE
ncbi:MAG: hypothetical protein U0R44_05385 [Candidatus Micrarchaeia archaeon]